MCQWENYRNDLVNLNRKLWWWWNYIIYNSWWFWLDDLINLSNRWFLGYPGGYGVYGGFGALGYGTHGVVGNYKQYYGYNNGYDPYDYKARSASDSTSQVTGRISSSSSSS